ncbi:hypothetical protein BACCIP111899_02711 [Bacillus rhizoplanae]|uniref:Uncharacterized protein n=1 Tax=Bacillus rhizoplanae TaxID=2880966 RepID=A0ABM8YCI6_9BACI|nr:hypothetical protein BACCIP111899_02711 [Bacillus rhizoplanae]
MEYYPSRFFTTNLSRYSRAARPPPQDLEKSEEDR